MWKETCFLCTFASRFLVYMSNKNFHIIRLGCASIQADEIKIAACLQKNGLSLSAGIADADFIIILTCGFSFKQYNDSIAKIKEINGDKKESVKIWIGGCVPAINKNFIQELPFEIDLIFAPRNFEKIINEYIEIQPALFQTNNTAIDHNLGEVYPMRIINGCTENCAYCVIKRAGGQALSQPIAKLEKEIRNIGSEIKCISLVGEDIGAYGKDIDTNLEELIKVIVQIHPKIKISFSTIHPKYFVQDFEMYTKIFTYRNVNPVLPVPIQSGSNKMLKLMKRNYDIDDVIRCFQIFISKFPDIRIQTDIMVGYPKETQDDFLLSKQIVEVLSRLSFLNCFKYDDVTALGNTVTEKEKRKRVDEIYEIFISSYKEKNNIQDDDALNCSFEKGDFSFNTNF